MTPPLSPDPAVMLVTVPPELSVLHPKPVPVVQMIAWFEAEHDGIAKPLGVVAVVAPSTVFAESVGSCV
jgi:hypothetical protein